MPRAFSSGAASIWSYALASPPNSLLSTVVIAAVSVVLPWSTCPIVPTFTWGLVRSNLAFAITRFPQKCGVLAFDLRHNLLCLRFRHFLVVAELHAVDGASLTHRAEGGRVAEHLGQRHAGGHHV